jgi:hypothetical protein
MFSQKYFPEYDKGLNLVSELFDSLKAKLKFKKVVDIFELKKEMVRRMRLVKQSKVQQSFRNSINIVKLLGKASTKKHTKIVDDNT